MKTLIKLTILGVGMFSAALVPLNAAVADAGTAAPANDQSAQAPGSHRAHPLRRMAIRHRVARKLGLSADQRSQLKTLRQSTAAAVKAIRADASLTPEQKKAKVRDTLVASRTQMRSVLTPDQQQELQHLRGRMKHRQAQ